MHAVDVMCQSIWRYLELEKEFRTVQGSSIPFGSRFPGGACSRRGVFWGGGGGGPCNNRADPFGLTRVYIRVPYFPSHFSKARARKPPRCGWKLQLPLSAQCSDFKASGRVMHRS